MKRSNFLTVFGAVCLVWITSLTQAQEVDFFNDWDLDDDGIFSWLDSNDDDYLDTNEVGAADDLISDYM